MCVYTRIQGRPDPRRIDACVHNNVVWEQRYDVKSKNEMLKPRLMWIITQSGIRVTSYFSQGRRKLSGRYGGRHTNPERWWAAPYQ